MKTPTTEQAQAALPLREAVLAPKLRELRQKLSQKAKQQKRYRFYSLYGLLCRADVLQAAWEAVQRNGGSPGTDGQTIAQIAATPESQSKFLAELQRSLVERTYRAQVVRRVYIPKANGKLRPLGIPTVRDRVVQAAVLLILEPIFEADFEDCSYGFRPGRSAHDALRAIHQYLQEGYTAVYDADLAGYFDSIPHDQLLACVRMRVVDGSVLALIQQWLKAPVIEPPSRPGDKPPWKRRDRGTPQGGVLSPLLANLYLHWFDRAFHRAEGPAQGASGVTSLDSGFCLTKNKHTCVLNIKNKLAICALITFIGCRDATKQTSPSGDGRSTGRKTRPQRSSRTCQIVTLRYARLR